MLAALKQTKAVLAHAQSRAEAQIKWINETYGPQIQTLAGTVENLDKEILARMKANDKLIFGDGDKISIVEGTLFRAPGTKITIPRGALEKIKELGLLEAIKTVESVKRDVVEKWPAEQLAAIGAKSKPHTEYKYEVKE